MSMVYLSAQCPTCIKYRKAKGYAPNDRHDYWQKKLPRGTWYHPTRFGRAFHKIALRNVETVPQVQP